MANEQENDEIVIDFKKIFQIINYRKQLILKTFILSIIIFSFLALILPKKYKVEADIYVNKTNTTNLSDINPFVLSSLGVNGAMGFLGAGNNTLQNEIEIIKSPLVLNNVIQKNNLRYKWGRKRGEYLTVKSFLKKNISIENKEETNVITITYISKDPLTAYNVVNSIITDYQRVNTEINTKKASGDKKLLQSSYVDTSKSVNQKLAVMKQSGVLPPNAIAGLGTLSLAGRYNRVLRGAIGGVAGQAVEGQKNQIAVDQEVGKMNMIKEKLEWTSLVEQMSKNASNVIVLKQPELKRHFEYYTPKLWINLILGIVFAIPASLMAVIWSEHRDKKLTYSSLGEKIIYDIENNIEDLKVIALSNNNEELLFLTFEGFSVEDFKDINLLSNLKIVQAELTSQCINIIKSSKKIIFAGKIGKTPKKTYERIKNICIESDKKIYLEVC